MWQVRDWRINRISYSCERFHFFGIRGVSNCSRLSPNEHLYKTLTPRYNGNLHVACEQALRGALAAGREKEGKLATMSLEFEYLHRKSRCEMLTSGDDSNDVITLGTCFSMFVYIRADWWKSDSSVDGEPRGNWRLNFNSKDVVASSPSFSHPAA